MKVTRTFDLLERYKNNFVREDIFVYKKEGKWINVSTQEYLDNSLYFSYGLLASGINRGDKIATISNNRPEWNFVDMGMAQAGIIHVPIFPSISDEEYIYILTHSGINMLIVSDANLYHKLVNIISEIPSVQGIYTFDKVEGALSWLEILELGKTHSKAYKEKLEQVKKEISPDDFATLIYTSGTTGLSKGVMLSHKNLVHNFLAAAEVFQLKPEDKYLSILPLCHVGGRLGNYQTQYSGASIYYAENMGAIALNIKEIKPSGFDAVPRILEKIFNSVIAQGKKLHGIKKLLFFWAVKLGLRYEANRENGWWYEKKLGIADKLIFSKWRQALGGNMKLIGCGGAALQPRLQRVFWAAGIKVLNMYGLTETSPIITVNRLTPTNTKLGTAGSVIEGVHIKIASDGEILCKGSNMMLGYYKDPEATRLSIDKDGWFHTGDIGELVDNKFLVITDRKKEIFKLSSGKYIAPQLIENKFKESIFIEQLMVIGENEKFASAIISPNFKYLQEWATKNNINYKSERGLINDPQVISCFQDEVTRLNKALNITEQIKRFILIEDEWSTDTGELSPTLKLKRKFISEKYDNIINHIYIKSKV